MTSLRPRALLVLAAASLGASSMGCSHNVYSPPANPMPFDAPRALDTGRTSVAISGGRSGAMFGPEVATGTLVARRGVAEGVDAEASGSVIQVLGSSSSTASRDVVAGRVGAKVELGSHHVAVTGGLGGGTSAGGGFVSPDLGIVAGYDNRYFIPFFAFRGMLSSPLSPRGVDVTPDGTPKGTFVDTPHFTQGLAATLGGRVPLGDEHAPGVSGALFGGLSFTKLYSNGNQEGFFGIGGGGEVSF